MGWLDRLCWECAGLAGLDARDLTLRELLWAADARQQAEWVRAACLTAVRANADSMSSKLDPAKLVPECYRGDGDAQPRERPRTKEQEEAEAAIGWRLLEQGLRAG